MIKIRTMTKTRIIKFGYAALLISIIGMYFGCGERYTPEQKEYISRIENSRLEKDLDMRENPSSPFNFKRKVEFHPLKYFDVDPNFNFQSKLVKHEAQDTVLVYGTKGDERKVVKFGYVSIHYNGKNYKVNVYEGSTRSGEIYHSIWFTDKTTNEQSYGVGRYIDFELVDDSNFIYTIDFNLAYNPYCAYNPDYSCAIPTKEDYIDLAITAGEKKFHD
ncbi:MAG: DUF1684 domain-containing protein [Bacteroidetes bacterium]|nr:DUF1684 domain-containing protein [Bacteroidota bacterium]